MRAATILAGILSLGFAICSPVGAQVPTSNGTLFEDDFSSGDLSKWGTGIAGGGTIAYDDTLGSPTGSLRIVSTVPDEAFGRPILTDATTESEWVTEFDFRLDSSQPAGDYFILYAAYATGFVPIDIELGLPSNTFTNPAPWDFQVGGVAGGASLAWDTWYHFTIHRVVATGVVDLYIDDVLMGTYMSPNPTLKLAEAQIGDVSIGNFTGAANWDNFSIGSPFPVIPPPTLTDVMVSNTVNMAFDSTDGADYAVEFVEDAGSTNWTPAGLVITGDGTTRVALDPAGVSSTRLYRLDVLGQ